MQIPGFLARKFYVKGSLRNTADGFALEAHNPMGDATLVGVGRIAVDGRSIDPADISATRKGDAAPIRATDLSRTNPIAVQVGDRVRLHVRGEALAPGEHRLEVELHELNIGNLRFSISDRLAESGG
ncbi:MAG: hypothetical protein H0V12_05810 [Chloroflexi bacterium]|nr:hypothetical protein [Chloroflexota bacterium]